MFTPPERLQGFTLSEVLVTLMIIGVVASMTVPSLIQSTQEKEFHSGLKKNFSALQNALQKGQIEEGLIGDNTAVFTPSKENDRSWESAKRLAKYMNTVKVCKSNSDDDCDGVYYPIKYATAKDGYFEPEFSAVVLADSSIYKIYQYKDCAAIVNSCQQDSIGNCLKDENGNDIMDNKWLRTHCADVYIDVNGAKKPNQFGKDVFEFLVYQDRVTVNRWGPYATEKQLDILTNKI